ncbi:MAG: glycine--tRNA ligase [Patescibacteria group bacterium]
MSDNNDLMDKIVSLSKRRGFIFPSCEIYGGFANSYSYGPYGVELKNNIKKLWWKMFVQQRADIFGIDGPIILHPKLWQASGHTSGFNDALIDCKKCKERYRADHLISEQLNIDAEGKEPEEMTDVINNNNIKCPKCGQQDFTSVRHFNGMFKTYFGTQETEENMTYLRPETAGAIFVDYKNVVDSLHPKLPFGIAQIGKAFRNEITPGNFIFRTREFEQMEIEYFINPDKWQDIFKNWQKQMLLWCSAIGLQKDNLNIYEHAPEKLAHYSKKTIDIEFKFPFGTKELYGLAYRTDFDLKSHAEASKQKLEYIDAENNARFIPHVIEPTFGLDRSILAVLLSAYHEETVKDETRVVLKLKPELAPVKVAVLPLSKKPELSSVAEKVMLSLKDINGVEYDATQSIGKRYRRQDEIGTPYCVTIDFETLNDEAVTVRERDNMKQERIKISELKSYLYNKLNG